MPINEYGIAYAEVVEILKYIPIKDYNKIPNNKIQVFEKYAQKDYKFVYNPEISLKNQNVSEKAKTIIALLFRDYWATQEQRDKIIAKENYDMQKLEKEKQEKYKTEDIFKNKKQDDISNNVAMVVYKESVFKRIIDKIKGIFNR